MKIIGIVLLFYSLGFAVEPPTICQIGLNSTPNITSLWHMNYDEDPIRDSSVNSHTGALKGAGEPNFVASKFGGGYDFDGDDDAITITDHVDLNPGTGAFTIMFWMNVVDTGNVFRTIFKYEDVDNAYFVQMNLDGNDDFYVGFRGGGTTENLDWVNSGYNLAGSWHQLVVTRPVNGTGNNHIYIDGVLANSWARTEDTDVSPAIDLTFGASALSCNGILDEVAILKRELSAAEIEHTYYRNPRSQ